MKRYENCATRLENRGDHPPTREYVDTLVEGILASGVEGCWHSAVSQACVPLYPSRVVPNCHPEANFEAFCYLLDKLHGIGRPVLSWLTVNHSDAVLRAYPEWRMQFLEMPGFTPHPTSEYICPNSPYGEMLPRFAAEIVREVGFDGIWFDGSTFSSHHSSPAFQAGCTCDFCRERFKRETGRELPTCMDFDSPDFRMWVNWRYDVLMDLWQRCVDAVREANPAALVCFNNYRRRTGSYLGWNTGIPMRRLGWDALMSGELDGFSGQADIQMKINLAYGLQRGTESWWPLCDHWNAWVPDTEPLSAVQAALGCVSAGGVACTGVGVDAKTMAYALREMEEAAAPRMPYLGGETIEYAAILVSQSTMDFYATPPDAWDGIHGANEFCRHAHLQSSVIFDDHIERGELDRYPVILLGNAACICEKQAEQLTAYVEAGGVLVACHEAGILDALGYPHSTPVLDELLGIATRRPGEDTLPTLERPAGELLERYVTFQGAHTLPSPAAEAEVLANTADHGPGSWDGLETGGAPFPRSPGMLLRRVGQGTAIYLGVDYFTNYLRVPTPHMLRLLKDLLTGLRPPRVTLRAPMCVTMNARVQPDGQWAVHLHNAPGSAYAYPTPPRNNYLHAPGEVVPVHDIAVIVHESLILGADSAITGDSLTVTPALGEVYVERLELQDVVLITVTKPLAEWG